MVLLAKFLDMKTVFLNKTAKVFLFSIFLALFFSFSFFYTSAQTISFSEQKKGSINVCVSVLDDSGKILNNSTLANLPFFSFELPILRGEKTYAKIFERAYFNKPYFSLNASIFSNNGKKDAVCILFDNLDLGVYFYQKEIIKQKNEWFEPLYNDDYTKNISSLTDFFLYDKGLKGEDKDFLFSKKIILTKDKPNRTLVILNQYKKSPKYQCSDKISNDNDKLIDEKDPACHTDNDAKNPDSYDPTIDNENERPQIVLNGASVMTIFQGDLFLDPKVQAYDAEDDDFVLTSKVIVRGFVDTSKPGLYSISYKVTDSNGLDSDWIRRIVQVKDEKFKTKENLKPKCKGSDCIFLDNKKELNNKEKPKKEKKCTYLSDYLGLDKNNKPSEVKKLQRFLRDFEAFSDLKITGVFDRDTFKAVSDFQVKYKSDILAPWGTSLPTGYVYITTKKKINEIYCQSEIALTKKQLMEINNFKKNRLIRAQVKLDNKEKRLNNSLNKEIKKESKYKKELKVIEGNLFEKSDGGNFLEQNINDIVGLNSENASSTDLVGVLSGGERKQIEKVEDFEDLSLNLKKDFKSRISNKEAITVTSVVLGGKFVSSGLFWIFLVFFSALVYFYFKYRKTIADREGTNQDNSP